MKREKPKMEVYSSFELYSLLRDTRNYPGTSLEKLAEIVVKALGKTDSRALVEYMQERIKEDD